MLQKVLAQVPEHKRKKVEFILKGMTDDQINAALHNDGACRVIASAGSGKTRVLVARVALLHILHEIPLNKIRANTFTKKAAEEMMERFVRLMAQLGIEVPKNTEIFSTIHSAAYGILRTEWKNQGIIDGKDLFSLVLQEWQQRKIIKDTIKELRLEDIDVGQVLTDITRWKNCLIHWTEAIQLDSTVGLLYRKYEEAKKAQGKIDFDDMLTKCYDLLRRNVALREFWSKRWDRILIDEFQDTSPVQWQIFKILAGGEVNIRNNSCTITTDCNMNIFVVGDDKQSIYAFRGANPSIIINFPQEFPGCREFSLAKNFRSDAKIIAAANNLIKNNENQVPLPAEAVKPGLRNPSLAFLYDEDEEGDFIGREILALKENSEIGAFDEVFVIYRTNAQSRAIEDSLIQKQIPYYVVNGVGFYGRKEIKDIVSYLAWFLDKNNWEAFKRIYNTPSRYLGKVFLDSVQESFKRSRDLDSAIREQANGRYSSGVADLISLRKSFINGIFEGKGNGDVIRWLIKEVGYDKYLQDEVSNSEDNDKMENIEQLIIAAEKFKNLREFVDYALEAGKPINKNDPNALKNKVQLMTIHGAKGLESKVVFLSMNLLPHPNSDDIEEERRLAYVGVTRAKESLYITCSHNFKKRFLATSQFISELQLEA